MKSEKFLTITVTHHFSASAERVFDAFLDPRKAARFMFVTEGGAIVRCDIDPRVGGKFVITDRRDGEDVAHEGEYLAIERPRRLVFTIAAKKYSSDIGRVDTDIKPTDQGCAVTLTQKLSAAWIERKSGIEAGWKGILVGLERTLAETGLYVDESVAIRAPAATVWRVLTEVALSRQWIQTWWPEVTLKSAWKLASPVVWEMNGGEIGAQGEVTAVNAPSHLAFTFQVSGAESWKHETVSYRLQENDGVTRLSVRVGDYGTTLDHEQCYPGALEAWNVSLPKIKAVAEELEAVTSRNATHDGST